MPSLSMRNRSLLWGLVLFALAVFRWGPELLWESERVDEAVYVAAAEALLAGSSPYDAPRFVYNPPFASFVALGIEHLGAIDTLILLRFLGLLGGVVMIWGPLAAVAWRRSALVVATCLLLFSPIVTNNITYGNVSFLILGMATLGLYSCGQPRGRIPGALLLGISVGLKPMAAAAIPLLGLMGLRQRGERSYLGAAVLAAASAVALQLFGWRFLSGLWQHAGGLPTTPHNIALSRVLYCFGVEVSSVLVMALVTLAAVIVLWNRPLERGELLALCGVVSVLGLPSVSLHTMAFTYPVQVLAVDRLVGRWRSLSGEWKEAAWVGTAIVAIHSGHGVGSMNMLSLPAQGALMAMPVLAPSFLALYLLTRPGSNGSPEGTSPRTVDGQ